MSGTSTQFRAQFKNAKSRAKFVSFLEPLKEANPEGLTESLVNMGLDDIEALIDDDWWDCQFTEVVSVDKVSIEFRVEAGSGAHAEIFEPLLILMANTFNAQTLLAITSDSTTDELGLTYFDKGQFLRFETGVSDGWDDRVYALQDEDRCFDSMLSLIDDGLPLGPLDIDIDSLFGEDATELDLAIFDEDYELSKSLLEGGADPNQRDSDGQTPLHFTVAGGDSLLEEPIKFAELLIRFGGQVNTSDKEGKTPLMCAAEYGDLEMVRFLATHGADLSARDKKGRNSLHLILYFRDYSPDHKQIETLKYLIKEGIDISSEDSLGNSPEKLALSHASNEVATAFKEAVA
jgi:hypothetical protein